MLVERPAVAAHPCRLLWSRLVSSKNSGVPVDHDPAGVDSRAAGVTEERAEQLDDAASPGGRVHVPDDASGEQLAGLLDRELELLEPLG